MARTLKAALARLPSRFKGETVFTSPEGGIIDPDNFSSRVSSIAWSSGLDLFLGWRARHRRTPDAVQRVQNGCSEGKRASGGEPLTPRPCDGCGGPQHRMLHGSHNPLD